MNTAQPDRIQCLPSSGAFAPPLVPWPGGPKSDRGAGMGEGSARLVALGCELRGVRYT